jgi:hypothetical protein
VIKSGRMRRAGQTAHLGEMKNAYKFWLENLKGNLVSHFEGGTYTKGFREQSVENILT